MPGYVVGDRTGCAESIIRALKRYGFRLSVDETGLRLGERELNEVDDYCDHQLLVAAARQDGEPSTLEAVAADFYEPIQIIRTPNSPAQRAAASRIAKSRATHGQSASNKTREYGIWTAMRSRCNNPNRKAYKSYGGRGIKICERWSSFEAFIEDMGKAPSDEHSIDRIDNDAGYSPDNCRWATQLEQNQNTRKTVLVTHNNETHCMNEWCRRLGVGHSTIVRRMRRGMTFAQAVAIPKGKRSEAA